MIRPTLRRVTLVLATSAAVLVGACGGEDQEQHPAGHSAATPAAGGGGVDLAFAKAMIPHHESAVEMAEVATERAESQFVEDLANDIITSQSAEIGTLNAAVARLEKSGVNAGDLGVAEHQMGMDADADDLRNANPFDRAFIDAMVPHHEGAIAMAEAELAKGEDPELRKLAQAIIRAQEREIKEMNAHRTRVYGGPVEDSAAHGEM